MVFVIFLVLTAIIGLLIGICVLRVHKPGETLRETIRASPSTLGAIVIFLLSFLAIGLVPESLANWHRTLLIRVLWPLGSGVPLAIAVPMGARHDAALQARQRLGRTVHFRGLE